MLADTNLTDEQRELYCIYLESKGNRDYLFADDIYSNAVDPPECTIPYLVDRLYLIFHTGFIHRGTLLFIYICVWIDIEQERKKGIYKVLSVLRSHTCKIFFQTCVYGIYTLAVSCLEIPQALGTAVALRINGLWRDPKRIGYVWRTLMSL